MIEVLNANVGASKSMAGYLIVHERDITALDDGQIWLYAF
jgi:hypothetical protein